MICDHKSTPYLSRLVALVVWIVALLIPTFVGETRSSRLAVAELQLLAKVGFSNCIEDSTFSASRSASR